MIPAIIWKEWREQRTVALTVLAFGVLALVLTASFSEHGSPGVTIDSAGPRELMAPALAYLAGIVCGAILLADEKEVGTIEFLDALPCQRRAIWVGKAIFGIGLSIFQAGAFAGMALALDCGIPRVNVVTYAIALILVALLAFSWGILGGALTRSTLGAVFLGAISSFVFGILLTIPIAFFAGVRVIGRFDGMPVLLHYVLWVSAGLFLSVAIFTKLDRRRLRLSRGGFGASSIASKRPRKPRFGLTALAWLSLRQAVYVLMGAVAAGVMVGAVMLIPEAHPVFVWPSVTLALGVLAGVTTLGEEQTRGVGRFWAERRLPLGRFWVVKVACHFAIAAIAALIVFAPLYAASPNILFRSRLWSQIDIGLRGELVRFLWLGLVYGFVIGHLAGMMFRKSIVAGLVATVTSATFIAAIAPSVLGGGAANWQVWAPALILLVTARIMLYPWATERILSSGPVLRLASGIMFAIVALAGGIAYRVYEIPDVPDRLVESGFESELPHFDAKDAGRSLRAATAQYRRAADEAKDQYPAPVRVATQSPMGSRSVSPDEVDPLERIINYGWSADSARLNPWLDRVFHKDSEWTTILRELPEKPIGVYEDPRDLDYFGTDTNRRDLRDMIVAIRARMAQRQAEGDFATFVELLPGALAACRTARNKSGWRTPEIAMQAEEMLFDGVDDWLAGLDKNKELVHAVLEIVANHARQMPTDLQEIYWADQVILRNTLQKIGTWLPAQIALRQPNARSISQNDPQADAQAELIAVAWNVPWERNRRERILRVHTHQNRRVEIGWLSGLHLRNMWGQNRVVRLEQRELRALTHRRLVQIQLAIRLVQLESNETVRSLDQLLSLISPEVLRDPYSDGLFFYRLATVQTIGSDAINRRDWNQGELMWIRVASELLDGLLVRDQWATAFQQMLIVLNAQIAMPMRLNGVAMSFAAGSAVPARNVKIVPGASIVWSAGADKQDNGGRRSPPRGVSAGPGQDWIVVVSPPDAKRK